MADLIELKVPDIGDFDSVEVIEVLVAEGDALTENQEVITVESDKAMMGIPAEMVGMLKELKVKVGDKVKEGDVLALVEAEAKADKEDEPEAESSDKKVESKEDDKKSAKAEKPAPKAESAPAKSESETSSQEKPVEEQIPYAPDNKSGHKRAHASPSVRRFARDLGVTLTSVTGSGPKGRITKEDVQQFVKSALSAPAAATASGSGIPAVPVINFEQFGEIEHQDLSRIKKISGKHLHACWLNIPHVTQFDEADITELEEFRKENKEMAAQRGVSLTPLVFIIKAVVACLKRYPEFNASLSEDKQQLILKSYYNIGVAVDTPNGLMVPVIRDVDKKGFLELAGELGELSGRAREGSLSAKDLQGGTFSISSLGGIGGQFFTPIVNAPEVAILGVSRHQMKPIWNGKEFEPRLMLPLSISYDHRVIDGASGARFTVMLNQMLSDIRKVLL